MRKAVIFIALALVLALGVSPAYANGQVPPVLPHAFYGSVIISNSPAPDGTQVSATVDDGEVITNVQNPTTTDGDSYGVGDSPYLLVQGNITPGAIITFYVNGVEAEGQTDTFEVGGGPTLRDLSVTIAAPAPSYVGGGGGRAAPPTVDTNLFGVEWSFRISDEGKILTTITATSADGMLAIRIPAGTIALDKYGNPLSSLTVDIELIPPDPPEDAHIIGLAYDFGPDGATFDPAITFTWSYDPDALPEGVAEEDLVVQCYPKEIGEWEECISSVDPVTNTVTASIDHFTCFAIIGAVPLPPPPPPAPAAFSLSNLSVKPAEVEPEEAVTITVSVANTGGTEGGYTVVLKINGVKEVEKSVTVAAGSSQDVSFSVTRKDAGSYSVVVDGLSASFAVVAPPAPPPPPPPAKPPVVPPVKPVINWPLIGGIIAAVVVVGLLIFFLVRRRAYLTVRD